MISETPIPADDNGQVRDASGRFASGNKFGKGNPLNKRVGQLRSALIRAVTTDDLRAIIAKLIELAKAGDVIAAREVLDRTLGKPVECDLLERLAELEAVYGVEP